MNCESALELLLDADPSEFSATERTPLGDHLRACARCRRVAAQLLHDTRGLAVAMEASVPQASVRRVRRTTLVPALATAALVLAVILRGPVETPAIVQSLAEPVAAAAPPVTATTEPPVIMRTATQRRVERGTRSGRAFARAVPLVPVRLQTSGIAETPVVAEPSVVTVTPPPGTRATVMHTSNPKLVVVWLH